MSLSRVGVWAVGVWDQTVWADGVWYEGVVAGRQPKKKDVAPKKYKNKRIDKLIEDLIAERLASHIEHGDVFIPGDQFVSNQAKIDEIERELAALVSSIKKKTVDQIAYQTYVMEVIQKQKNLAQQVEDELVAILLLAA